MAIVLVSGVVVLALVLFSIESIPIEVTSLVVVCVLALTRVLTPQQAFAGFANETVIFIFTLLAMTQGLAATGVVTWLGQSMAGFSRFGASAFILAMMVLVGAFSSLVSNTVTTAAFLPVAMGAAERAKVPRSQVLMPLAFASMLGGTVFLYGTSTNLVVNDAMVRHGLAPIGFLELAPIGLPLACVGIGLVIFLGPRVLPSRGGRVADIFPLRDFLAEAVLPADSRYVGRPLADISEGLGISVLGLVRRNEVLPADPKLQLSTEDTLLIEADRKNILRVKDLRGIELRSELKQVGVVSEGKDSVWVEASVPPGSLLVRRSLKETLFSERFGLVVLAIHRRPAIQRLTKLQLLSRSNGREKLSSLPLSVGDVLLLRGPRARVAQLQDGATLTVLTDIEYQPARYKKALVAVGIFVSVLFGVSLAGVSPAVAGLVGMLAMIASGCVDARLAFRVDWRVVLLIGSMMALGTAMETSGTGAFLGGKLLYLQGLIGTRGVLLMLMLLTVLLSWPMSNQASALVMLPVALSTASQLGVDARPFALGICFAASYSFMTPLEPSCVLVYGPGQYRFSDFFRLGTPLTAVLLALLAFGVPWMWPF